MSFKTQQDKDDFNMLSVKNNKLHTFIEFISKTCDVTITDVHRTKKRQIELYGYYRPSKHIVWSAVDIRSHSLSEFCFDYIKEEAYKERIKFIYHKIKNNANHIHLEV